VVSADSAEEVHDYGRVHYPMYYRDLSAIA